jgi:hypothetical protein
MRSFKREIFVNHGRRCYMNYVLNRLGAVTVGSIGVAVGANPTTFDAAIDEVMPLEHTLAEAI